MNNLIQTLIKISETHPQLQNKTEKVFQGHATPSTGLTLEEFRSKYQKMHNEEFPISQDQNITIEFLLTLRLMSTHRRRGRSQVFYLLEPKTEIISFIRDTGFLQ
ncbi:uncharacterized protein LOC119662274 [Teleopsis dalmanni]|uniref:uncharacterized protein LOC119662274 n=1 Tax=Teleopsis dalmanni TaxID=139649 RepID=UPI0018CEF4FB|nr:uncharacterized protein LOC119662274 [Teleopsis dalmanni]